MRIHVTFSEGQNFNPRFTDTDQSFSLNFGEFNVIRDAEWWDGEYEITPSNETQTLATKDKAMRENLVINPIPNNYGLITYNGYEIRVT